MTCDITAASAGTAFDLRTVTSFYDGSISLKNGTVAVRSAQWETERLSDGLKLIVISSGELKCKLPHCPQTTISSPSICAVWNQGEHEGMQAFEPGASIRYTAIELSPHSLERRLAGDFHALRERFETEGHGRPHLVSVAATRPIQALCAQAAACPLTGIPRNFYLSGKALEITALILSALETEPAGTSRPRLLTGDIERIYAARDILAARLQSPPTLAELSLAAGINIRKLKTGFLHLFGDTVFGYLQKLRLETAYRLLTEEEMSVSSAAYRVGYSPAHFSVAFRKKYGSSPKSIKI